MSNFLKFDHLVYFLTTLIERGATLPFRREAKVVDPALVDSLSSGIVWFSRTPEAEDDSYFAPPQVNKCIV